MITETESRPATEVASASKATLWRPLAARFTVHLPAHPGFDESTGLEQVDGMFDYVLHYVDLLDTLRLGAVPVVGTSLGGWVAAELAALYPARVDRLVLVDAVGLWIDAAPMGELFGSTPPELATMIFHDQEHPLAQMMRAMTPTAIAEVPEAFAYAQLKALEASAKIGWNPSCTTRSSGGASGGCGPGRSSSGDDRTASSRWSTASAIAPGSPGRSSRCSTAAGTYRPSSGRPSSRRRCSASYSSVPRRITLATEK